MMASHEIESARLNMLEARKALDDYEWINSYASAGQHTRLTQIFTKASRTYLACFIRERAMRGEVESVCAPLRQVAPGWRRV